MLTEVCEIRIIELPKLKRLMKINTTSSKEKALEKWVKFLLTPNEMEEIDMEDNENIKKAKEEFNQMQKDEYEQRMAELRMKHILDSKAIEEYGYDKGVEAGKKEGELQEKRKIAKEMIADGVDIKIVEKYTNLSKKEIEALTKEHQTQ